MRYSTGLTLLAMGAVLLFAVSANVPYLNLKVVGLVLIGTGLAGLRLPQRGWRWLRAHSDELRTMLDQAAAVPEPQGERVPLDALLGAANGGLDSGSDAPPR